MRLAVTDISCCDSSVCVCVCVCLHVCVCLSLYILYIYISLSPRVSVCVSLCACACAYVRACTCASLLTYVRMHTHFVKMDVRKETRIPTNTESNIFTWNEVPSESQNFTCRE